MSHLVDTPVKLGQCNRCEAYVFLAMASGVRSAADVAPADRDAYIAAVVAGRRVFRLLTQAGRPYKLLTARLGSPGPSYDAAGAQNGAQSFLVEHSCGAHARNMITFREVEQGPPPNVCDTWQAQGWVPPPGKCRRARTPSVVSCPTCDPPPF